MASRYRTTEWRFETRTANLATATALGDVNLYTPPAVTCKFPSNIDSWNVFGFVEVFVRCADPSTARRLDGCRIGIRIDGGTWNATTITGTGIANTGDHYSARFSCDVGNFLGPNCTGDSHSIEIRAEFETDVAANVNNIFAVLTTTYQLDEDHAGGRWIQTVRIPMEGNTAFLSTTANTNIRGSTGAGQIPALDTWLPESNKTYEQIAIHVFATDAGAATTDFNMNLSISGGATHTCSTLEQGLNTSVWYEYVWVVPDGYFDTSVVRDLQAWSSLANRFERFYAIMYVTYTYDKPTSGQVMNSLLIPLSNGNRTVGQSAALDDCLYAHLMAVEPNVTLKQSAVQLFYFSPGASTLRVIGDVGYPNYSDSQSTTTATYTNTALVGSGGMSLCHRLDVAHGGTAASLDRGYNMFRISLRANAANAINTCTGMLCLNYTSDIDPTYGAGAHNKTLIGILGGTHSGTIAGAGIRALDITEQWAATQDPAETHIYINALAYWMKFNSTGNGAIQLLARNLDIPSADGQEYQEAGWTSLGWAAPTQDGEYGHSNIIFNVLEHHIRRYRYSILQIGLSNKYEHVLQINSTITAQWSLIKLITYHHLRWKVSGVVTDPTSGSTPQVLTVINAGMNNVMDFDGFGSIVGGGSYTLYVPDNVYNRFVIANEGAAERHGGSSFGLPTT